MRKVKNYILRNWLLIVIGCILQVKAMQVGLVQRGGFQIGGDMFVLAFVLLIAEFFRIALRYVLDALEEIKAWEE